MSGLFKISRYGLLLFLCSSGFLFSAENRFALVIGNSNYRDKSIPSLTNPINDASDVAASLGDLGYHVTLKTNIGLRDMMSAIKDFTNNLGRSQENEGFFWFAGHGLSVRGVHYMLPVDVETSDESIIARGSYAVDELMEEIENARNRTNLVVIDACRNNFLPSNDTRGLGTRGLAVMSRDDYRIRGNKIVYSTSAGRTAADGGPGTRNSPFAQAFISNMKNPETFDDVLIDIASETLRLTRGEQEPYSIGTFSVKSYTLNPRPVEIAEPVQSAAPPAVATPVPSVDSERLNPASPGVSKTQTGFGLDNKKVFSFGIAPIAYGSTFFGLGGGIGLGINFLEKYRNYGDLFFIPNSFHVSADLFIDTHSIENELGLNDPKASYEAYAGAIMGIGASYKIRLGQSQRLILEFGPSFELFIGSREFFYDDVSYADYNENGIFEPGFGVHGGISFRLSRLISLDFNMAYKMSFIGTDILVDYNYLIQPYATKIHPYTFGGSLGISFWFSR